MSSNILNNVPFLRTTRNFPEEPQPLSVEINKSYLDISTCVNSRIIGIFTGNKPTLTGEAWFFEGSNQKQQTFRQIYPFITFANIPHGINTTQIGGFTKIYGAFSDGTNFYPLPYVSPTAANQVGLSVTPTDIVFSAGAGAPVPVSGVVVLEWLTNI